MSYSGYHGFALGELLVTVLGFLAAKALPVYQNHVNHASMTLAIEDTEGTPDWLCASGAETGASKRTQQHGFSTSTNVGFPHPILHRRSADER